MKRTLFLLLIFATANTYSQNYQISFAGTGAATIVDSVKVENLTQGTSLSIPGVDVLHLTGSTGINNLDQNKEIAIVNPNPMQGKAELLFYAKKSGNARIIIYDISGKEVAKVNDILSLGTHKFEIDGLIEGSYIINVSGANYQYNVKLISKTRFQGKSSIKYLGNVKSEAITKTLKSTRSLVDMAYTTGDNLRFTGFSGIYIAIVKDVPTSDKTIMFTFIGLPVITTTVVSAITDTSAISGGIITSDGGAPVTARGVCWSINQNPTLTDNFTNNSSGMGSFSSNLTGLNPNTAYFVKAYATNSMGTVYGNQLSFTTVSLPVVTTTSISAITDTTAISGGNITSDGGATVTARGVCWSINQNPTLIDSFTKNGSGMGSFSSNLTGLKPISTYYVRAYAINGVGTVYGNQLSFSTPAIGTIPTVTTSAISNIRQLTASSGGKVTSQGSSAVTVRGVCWSNHSNPTTANYTTKNGKDTGSFVSNLTGLTSNYTYYVRAYATNSVGTAYGNELSFTTDIIHNCGSVSDTDGNTYTTVIIGTQCWMKENLKTTHYRNGDSIPQVTDNTIWSGLITGAICNFYNSTAYGTTYGRLFNWYSVNNIRKICPTGWHVPTDAEWTTLTDYLTNYGYGYQGSGTDIAKSMAATSGWVKFATKGEVGNDQASNNISGFTALPAGYRQDNGTFGNFEYASYWWSSTEYSRDNASTRIIYSNYSDVTRTIYAKLSGFSVRCLKD